jgi:ferredoxin/flavodoxin
MNQDPRKALVLTYSQTGHTRLYGRLVAAVWKQAGLTVTNSDIRDFDLDTLPSFDLIMAGTPVFYFDVPSNVIAKLEAAPRLDGIPVAAFATFGGEGGHQHNTAHALLRLFTNRGGIGVGIEKFGNMSSFSPTWSIGNEKRILKYRDRPNRETFRHVREFAEAVLLRAREGTQVTPGREFYASDFLKGRPSIAFTKLFIGRHRIDPDSCTGCEVCEKGCPVGAIDLSSFSLERNRCIACFGCVNNCPADAVDMTYLGKKVYGFREFRKRHGIVIEKPDELK